MKTFGAWKNWMNQATSTGMASCRCMWDDILVTGEEFAVHGALQALSGVWTTSSGGMGLALTSLSSTAVF